MKKINRHITSSKKLIEDKIKEVGLISAKGLTKESINGDSVLNGAIYFADNGSQNYWVFPPLFRCAATPTSSDRILAWNSKGLPEESSKTPNTSNSSLASQLIYIHNGKIAVKFEGICLKQNMTCFNERNVKSIVAKFEDFKILKFFGLLTKEAPPWLGPTVQKIFEIWPF